MDFPTSSNYCLMMFPLMSHPFHHRFLFHSQLHLVRGFRTIFLIRPTFGQNIYPRIMRPQWPPWTFLYFHWEIPKKNHHFSHFSPWKVGQCPSPDRGFTLSLRRCHPAPGVAGPALAALALRTKRGRSRLKRGDFTKNDGVPSGYLTVRHGK